MKSTALPGAFEDLIKEECIKALFNDKERRKFHL